MVKKVENFVFYPKWLYGAKNGQILETPKKLTHRKKEKPYPKERTFQGV
jgi:hypothetical protein